MSASFTTSTRVSAEDLLEATELLGEDLHGAARSQAHDVLERISVRDSLSPTTIVAAFVGATGSGKSSLFNAVCGAELAKSSVVRPTTRLALAALPSTYVSTDEPHDVDRLLDWLNVQQRVALPPQASLAPSLVLLDVPDIDSVDEDNHLLAQRLAERVDLLIWVVDPQKYADHVIHRQWIAPMASRAQAMVTVLNQIDRLDDSERQSVVTSLQALLIEDGVASPVIMPTSALTGQGVPALLESMNATAEKLRTYAVVREAQLHDLVQSIRGNLAIDQWHSPRPAEEISAAVANSIVASTSVKNLCDAVENAYVHRGARRCGWLPWRLLRALRSDPLRQRHLSGSGGDSVSDVDLSTLLGPSGVSLAVRTGIDMITQGRPPVWQERIETTAHSQMGTLVTVLQRGIARTDLGLGVAPRWWALSRAVQSLMWVIAAAGALWLAGAYFVQDYLFIPIDFPRWGKVPIPTVLLGGGMIASACVAMIAAICRHFAAKHHRRFAARALSRTISSVVDQHIVAPLREEDQRQRRIVYLLTGAAHEL